MSAEILRLPVTARPRLVASNESNDFRERELREAEMFLDQVAFHIAMARRPGADADAELRQAAHAAEGMLFHLLTAAGALNSDLDLRRLLSRRLAEREADHG